MIDYGDKIVEQLSEILPTYYELFCDSNTSKPCITYKPADNYEINNDNGLGYSGLKYHIKLWGDQLSYTSLCSYMQQIADVMTELHFKREAYNELVVNQQICMIATYTAVGYEDNITEET